MTRVGTEVAATGEIDGFLFERCDVHTASYCGSSVPYNPCMTLTERRLGDVTVLDLNGRLVLEEGDTVLRECLGRLIEEGRFKIVLNLGDVSYIDSCGIGVLIAKFVSFRRKGGDVRLLHVTSRSMHLLEISKLVNVFRMFESEGEAVASFGTGAQS